MASPVCRLQKINTADLDDRRIFDRILEVCVPIMFDGDSFRKSTAADNLKTAARLLG